jgi:hypothetical protein
MAAARRKTGGLQWGDFPWGSGAKNHRKTTGPWPLVPIVSRPKKQGVILRPNKPPGRRFYQRPPIVDHPATQHHHAAASRAASGQPHGPRASCVRSAYLHAELKTNGRRKHAAGSTSCARWWLCAANSGRPAPTGIDARLHFFLASASASLPSQKHGSIFNPMS